MGYCGCVLGVGGLVVVFKVGGSLLRSPRNYVDVAETLASQEEEKVIVVSAMKGATQLLIDLVDKPSSEVFLSEFCSMYYEAMSEVGGDPRLLSRLEEEGLQILKRIPRARATEKAILADRLVSLGEKFSSAVLTEALQNLGVEAKNLSGGEAGILTDESFGCARPLIPESFVKIRVSLLPIIESGKTPVVCGFTGVTRSGLTTTLGRGGSDLTATLIGAALSTSRIELWTDSGGIYTGEPGIVSGARIITHISIGEADAMARFRVKNFHPLTFKPLAVFSGTVIVRDPFDGEEGTVISRSRHYPPLKTVRLREKELIIIGWGAPYLAEAAAKVVEAEDWSTGRFYVIMRFDGEEDALSACRRIHDYIIFDMLRGETPWLIH